MNRNKFKYGSFEEFQNEAFSIFEKFLWFMRFLFTFSRRILEELFDYYSGRFFVW